MTSRRRWPTAVDLFCGCGGVTTALKQRHFRVVAAVDHDTVACETYRANHPTVNLHEQDCGEVEPAEIRASLNGDDLDLLVVCAPCQPFSSQTRASGPDNRANLVLETVRFAKVLNPAVILIENVPGLVRAENGHTLRHLRFDLAQAGYKSSDPLIVDAQDYGVPQRRRRFLMLAAKGSSPPRLPPPTTPSTERVTVRETIEHYTPLESGEGDPHDPLHRARNHQEIALRRLRQIPKDGGDRKSLPPELELGCHKGYRGHPDVYGRMAWDDVAPTLTTGCTDVTRGRFAHPRDDRGITLREAAALQTFPDSYLFKGNHGQIASQIGNAVPPRLVWNLVPGIRASIKQARGAS